MSDAKTINTTYTIPETLADWCRAAWQVSKDHGWHDDPLDGQPERMPIRIALLHSEVSELLEAFRDNPFAPCDKPGLVLSRASEELADIPIRLFDYVAEFKLNAFEKSRTIADAIRHARCYECASEEIGAEICRLHAAIGKLDTHTYHAPNLLITLLARFAVHHGIDLETAIVTKHNYNKTRSHRHGGKAF